VPQEKKDTTVTITITSQVNHAKVERERERESRESRDLIFSEVKAINYVYYY